MAKPEVKKKKSSSKPTISSASIHREVKKAASAGTDEARAGKEVTMASKKILEDVIKKLAEKVTSVLAIAKRKTVSYEHINECLKHNCLGVSEKDWFVADVSQAKKKRRTTNKGEEAAKKKAKSTALAEASVVKVFKYHLGDGVSVGGVAKVALRKFCEAFLAELSHRAGLFAASAKRHTINSDDMVRARETMSF